MVTVSVPATIANLGVGYDVLGMAIDERNELSVRVSGLAASGARGDVNLEVRGEGLGELPTDRRNVAVGAVVRGQGAVDEDFAPGRMCGHDGSNQGRHDDLFSYNSLRLRLFSILFPRVAHV